MYIHFYNIQLARIKGHNAVVWDIALVEIYTKLSNGVINQWILYEHETKGGVLYPV